jgi:hypothetical protein
MDIIRAHIQEKIKIMMEYNKAIIKIINLMVKENIHGQIKINM